MGPFLEQINTLPEKLQWAITSPELEDVLTEIEERHNLSEERAHELTNEVMTVLLGADTTENFQKNIEETVGGEESDVQELVQEVREAIFEPLASEIQKAQPTTQEEIVSDKKPQSLHEEVLAQENKEEHKMEVVPHVEPQKEREKLDALLDKHKEEDEERNPLESIDDILNAKRSPEQERLISEIEHPQAFEMPHATQKRTAPQQERGERADTAPPPVNLPTSEASEEVIPIHHVKKDVPATPVSSSPSITLPPLPSQKETSQTPFEKKLENIPRPPQKKEHKNNDPYREAIE